jgi:hypothetical protein
MPIAVEALTGCYLLIKPQPGVSELAAFEECNRLAAGRDYLMDEDAPLARCRFVPARRDARWSRRCVLSGFLYLASSLGGLRWLDGADVLWRCTCGDRGGRYTLERTSG